MPERARIPESGFMIGDGQTLACLGDSITEAQDGYVTVMANLMAAVYPERRIQVINCGISGNKAPDMLTRLAADVISRDPDWVTVNVGINDVWHGFFDFEQGNPISGGGGPNGVPLTTYEPVLREIVGRLLSASRANVLLVTPTVIGEDQDAPENQVLQGYVEAMERVARETGVRLCPMRQAFQDALRRGKQADPTYSLTMDGVHMNTVGNHVMAVTILRSLAFFSGLSV